MIYLLAVLTAVAWVGGIMYTPALPAVAAEFQASNAEIQVTLATFMAGFAIGQLAYGSVSDRFGRRPVLLISLVIYGVGTVAVALAPNLGLLSAARVLQAVGAAGGVVLARAVVRDIVTFEGAARGMAILNIGSSIAPALSLVAGGALAAFLGWRGLFWLSAGLIVIFYVVTHFALRETRPPELRTRPGFIDEVRGWLTFLRSRVFLTFAVSQALLNSAIFAFVAGGPFFLIDQLGASESMIGILLALFPTGFLFGNLLSTQISGRVSMSNQLWIGALISTVAGALFLALHSVDALGLVIIGVLSFTYTFGVGLHIPNATAGAIEVNPRLSGTGSALYGFITFGATALSSLLVGFIDDGSGDGLFALMLALGVGGLLMTFVAIAVAPSGLVRGRKASS